MDKNQQLLVSLLSAAMRGQKPQNINIEGADWKVIFEEAKAHYVHAIIYPVLNELEGFRKPGDDLMAKWKRAALLSGAEQARHMHEVGNVLQALNSAKIPVIALKGLVLRELYPRPELRIMSDADILVHKEDIKRAKSLLMQMGYYIDDSSYKHVHFSHKAHLPVELHQFTHDEGNIKNAEGFERSIWEKAVPSVVCGVPILTLSPEDQVLHLCIHMADHIRFCGFGLRQLCDLVLLVEKKEFMIDWGGLHRRSEEYGIERFLSAVFTLCSRLFGMDITHALSRNIVKDEDYMEHMTGDILKGGVYGYRIINHASSAFFQWADYKSSNTSRNKLLQAVPLLFPPAHKLGLRYEFARKYPVLTPAAWVHRLLYGIVRRDFSISEKLRFLIPSKDDMNIINRRIRLLRWLGLR